MLRIKTKGDDYKLSGNIKKAKSFFKKELKKSNKINVANANCALAIIYKEEYENSNIFFKKYYKYKYLFYLKETIKYDIYPIWGDFEFAFLKYEEKDIDNALIYINKAIKKNQFILNNIEKFEISSKSDEINTLMARLLNFKGIYLRDNAKLNDAINVFMSSFNYLKTVSNNRRDEVLEISKLIIENIVIIYLVQNKFSEATSVLKGDNIRNEIDFFDDIKLFTIDKNLPLNIKILDDALHNFINYQNVSEFSGKYFSELNQCDQYKDYVKLRKRILDAFEARNFANDFLRIGDEILKHNQKIRDDLIKSKLHLENIKLSKPELLSESQKIKNNLFPEIVNTIKIQSKAIKRIHEDNVAIKKYLINFNEFVLDVNDHYIYEIKQLAEKKFAIPVRQKFNWFYVKLYRQFFRIAILVLFLGFFIPFILSGFTIGIIFQIIITFSIWLFGEKIIESWIENKVTIKAKSSLLNLILTMSNNLYLQYNILIQILSKIELNIENDIEKSKQN